jgi:hypothetical protein
VDELEWLRRNAPATRPSPETTRRHRTQLRAAIAEEGAADTPRPRRPRRDRPRHRVLLGATAVAALCALVAAVVTLAGSGDDAGRRVAAPAADTTGAATGPPACGSTLPAAVAVPAGFGAPQAVSAPMAPAAASASQLVETWSSSNNNIEVRWPSDTDRRPWAGEKPDPGANITGLADPEVTTTERGISYRSVLIRVPGERSPCDTVQLTVYGKDAAEVRTISDALARQPFAPTTPQVTGASTSDSVPTVVGCVSADGIGRATATGGAVSTATFAQPTEALADFVRDPNRTLLPTGYRQLNLPDGSVAYVNEPRPGVVVTTVQVTQRDTGWSVSRWDASPC